MTSNAPGPNHPASRALAIREELPVDPEMRLLELLLQLPSTPCRTCRKKPGTHFGECKSCFSADIDLEKGYSVRPDIRIVAPTEPIYVESFGDIVVIHALIDTRDTTVCGIGEVKVCVDPVPAGALRCNICHPIGGRS